MNTRPIWKRTRLLWILIITAGIMVCMAAMFQSLSMMILSARPRAGLMRAEKLPDDAVISIKAYREAYREAIDISETADRNDLLIMIPGGIIVLLALWGLKLSKKTRQLEENAQPSPAGDAETSAPEE